MYLRSVEKQTGDRANRLEIIPYPSSTYISEVVPHAAEALLKGNQHIGSGHLVWEAGRVESGTRLNLGGEYIHGF